jgi:hypothetical protein
MRTGALVRFFHDNRALRVAGSAFYSLPSSGIFLLLPLFSDVCCLRLPLAVVGRIASGAARFARSRRRAGANLLVFVLLHACAVCASSPMFFALGFFYLCGGRK